MINSKIFFKENFQFSLAEKVARRDIWRKKLLVEQWQQKNPEERKLQRQALLENIVEYAFHRVPFYRDLFRRIRFDPGKIRKDIRYFQDIPFLTKETILSQPMRFRSLDFVKSEFIEKKTSGSTGATFSFYYSKEDLDWASAVVLYLNQSVSHDLSHREVHLIATDSKEKSGFSIEGFLERLKLIALNRANIYVRDFSPSVSQSLLQLMKSEKPYLIYGLQSILRAVIQSSNGASFRDLCQYFISSGETLDEKAVDVISQAIGCKVINRYGNAEFGAVAQSADDPLFLKFVEGIVYPENLTIQEYPEIVLTTLMGRAMPLLRYRTGDLGLLQENPDGSITLSNVHGRLNEIVTIEKKQFHTTFLASFLNNHFLIHDFQIVQRSDGVFEFRIITDCPDQLPNIKKKLTSLTGGAIMVSRIRPSELIRKGRQRKFAYFIQE